VNLLIVPVEDAESRAGLVRALNLTPNLMVVRCPVATFKWLPSFATLERKG